MANASSTSSSITSTSHTMTADPLPRMHAAPKKSQQKADDTERLFEALQAENRHIFIQPPTELYEASIQFAKNTLDEAAAQLCDEQAARIEEDRKNRKRKRESKRADTDILKIRKIHTEGFAVDQIWEQAKRVIDALSGDVERGIEELDKNGFLDHGDNVKPQTNGTSKSVRFEVDEMMEEEESEDGDEDEEDLGNEEDSAIEDADAGELVDVEEEVDEEYGDEDEEGSVDMDRLLDDDDQDYDEDDGLVDEYVEDPHGLNDGFFSIDAFNKETEFLERQDAAADPYTGEASDEEDIDWDADPMALPTTSRSERSATKLGEDGDEENDDDEDEGGPTFGNVGLNAPEGESDVDEDEDMDDLANGIGENTNEVMYKDFFEPPPRKASKGEKQAKYLARQEKKTIFEDEETQMNRAMADVRRDLFEDLSEEEDSNDALSDVDPSDPKSRRSAHERRQAKITDEIRRLEAAAVAKREWTLAGEARAADRPLNSLLEEDLDFERTGKPVPVITAAVTESIEELIKRRILAQEFDEVIRRRPDADSMATNARRGLIELDDNKAQQSLAEIYEEEHIKRTNPDTYMSKADEKLKNQHQEIDTLWKDVSAKLDALSSWHYKPKPPAPSLSVVADVATISMEDAQPSTGGAIGASDSMLAPQEIYTAGKDKSVVEKGEVVPKSGLPAARQEMTREEKLRRRRREKERIKKRGGLERQKPESKKAKEKRETIGELKRGGVKVIGRRGEIKDIDGNKVNDAGLVTNASRYKL